MPDTDADTKKSLAFCDPWPTLNGGTACEATLGNGTILRKVTNANGSQSCFRDGAPLNFELDAKSVMNAMSLSHGRFDPLFDQVRKELEYEESRSQQDPNADPATLTAKQDAFTEVINHTARYFEIYHPNLGGHFMTENDGVVKAHQDWMEATAKLCDKYAPTGDNRTATSAISGSVLDQQ